MKAINEILDFKGIYSDNLQFSEDGIKGFICIDRIDMSFVASWGGGWDHVSVAPLKKKCEHYYTEFMYARNPIQCSIQLLLRCEKCKEVTLLNCSENMIFDMLKNSFEV